MISGDCLIGAVGGALAGSETPLGIVPGGRGNDLARVLGIPSEPEAAVAMLEAGHTRLVVDVEKVEFLDSTGLGVLVGALKKVRADGGTLDIVCTQERILKIFDITGLDKVFGLHESVAHAIATHD